MYMIDADSATDGDSFYVTFTATDPIGAATQNFFVDVGEPDGRGDASFSYLSTDPGKNTRYELRFPAPKDMNTLTDEIVIELEDFTVPSSIDEDSIAVTVTLGLRR